MGIKTLHEQSSGVANTARRYTAQEFEDLPMGPPWYELINNRLVMEPSPEIPHQRSSLSLVARLFNFVEEQALGLVLEAPMDVELDEGNVFQPDILFISNDRLHIIQDGRKIKGAPDLVVEILSSNKKYDRQEKKSVYERHNVRELWLLDTQKKTVEVFENQHGKFVLQQKAQVGDTVYSRILDGFEVAAAYLFREIPRP
jgi:Uma2 family endonuclease